MIDPRIQRLLDVYAAQLRAAGKHVAADLVEHAAHRAAAAEQRGDQEEVNRQIRAGNIEAVRAGVTP